MQPRPGNGRSLRNEKTTPNTIVYSVLFSLLSTVYLILHSDILVFAHTNY